jgi:dipeptidyl aminopeptidase/acylaminoacyl peptidase
MAQRFLVPEDLYRLRWVNDPQISPDGQTIAYVLKTIDRETNTYRTAIWVTPAAGGPGKEHPFTSDGTQPRWSPDGQWLAFVSEREGVLPEPENDEEPAARDKRLGKGKGQIWVISATGGEAQQLTFMRYGASDPAWSPDGQTILFSAKTGDIFEPPEHDGKREPRSHRIKEIMYRFNQANYIYEQRTHLFTVPAAGGAVRQITDGDWDDGEAAWSPDGRQIIFTSDRHEDRWRLPMSELWLTRADGSDTRCLISDPQIFFSHPAWSPDGTRIACLGEQAWKAGGHTDVYVFAPGEKPHCITEQHFVTFSDAIGSDQRSEHADPTPRWSSDGETLFVLGNARGAGNVYALRASDGALSEVTSGSQAVLGFSLDRAQNAVALAITDPSQPSDIFIHWRDTGTTMRLTEVNAKLLGEVHLATPEEFEFSGADGWTIEGWILKPAMFDPSQRYPMVLEVHGGPNTAYGYAFNLEFQVLAGRSFVVLYTNPRGSTSYGREFGKAVHGAWGEGDYQDLMCGVDALLARGYVDPERMGVTGGSYGGFMTNWIIGHTDRFKAAVTQRSVTNLLSKFGTSDIGPWMALDNWDGAWWEQYERYRWHSPITYVQNMHTPLLIIHSDRDWRCPIEQAEQLFTALKWLRREVELLRFENENHELSRSGHPRLRVERMTAIADWMTNHLTTRREEANGHTERHAEALREEELVGAPSPVTDN